MVRIVPVQITLLKTQNPEALLRDTSESMQTLFWEAFLHQENMKMVPLCTYNQQEARQRSSRDLPAYSSTAQINEKTFLCPT